MTNLRRMSTAGFLWAGIIFGSALAHADQPPWNRHVIDGSLRGADGVRLADFNRDGLLDIVTGWEESGVVRLYLNPGAKKSKMAWPAVTVGESRSPEDAVAFDVDGDGTLEVISCHEGKSRRVMVHRSSDQTQLLSKDRWESKTIKPLDGQAWMFAEPIVINDKPALTVGAKGSNGTISLAIPNGNSWSTRKLRDAGWIMTLKTLDMDGDGDQDLVYSDRKGPNRGVGWLEQPRNSEMSWRDHTIGGSDAEVMFMDSRVDQMFVATRGANVLQFSKADTGWKRSKIENPSGVRFGKAVRRFGKSGFVFTANTAADKQQDLPGIWLREDGNWQAIDLTTNVKPDRIEVLDLDQDGDLDVLTCEERRNLGVIWYENPSKSQ